MDLIHGAIVLPRPQIYTVEFLLRLHFLDAMRARILLQTEKVAVDLFPDMRVEFAEVPLGGRSDFNTESQDSVSQFSHEVTERDSPFFFRFFQRSAGVLQVQAVS